MVAIKVFKDNASSIFRNELLVYQQLKGRESLKCIGYYSNMFFKNCKNERMLLNCLILEYAQHGEFFNFIYNKRLNE